MALKGLFEVEFNEMVYYPGQLDEQHKLLEALLTFAAECYISKEYFPLRRAVLLDFPQFKEQLTNESDLDIFIFLIFDEGHGCESFEAALALYSSVAKGKFDLADPDLLELTRRFWEEGVQLSEQFKLEYSTYFCEALEANPYAPTYAFGQACEKAGLPLDEWASAWPDHLEVALGYSLTQSVELDYEISPPKRLEYLPIPFHANNKKAV